MCFSRLYFLVLIALSCKHVTHSLVDGGVADPPSSVSQTPQISESAVPTSSNATNAPAASLAAEEATNASTSAAVGVALTSLNESAPIVIGEADAAPSSVPSTNASVPSMGTGSNALNVSAPIDLAVQHTANASVLLATAVESSPSNATTPVVADVVAVAESSSGAFLANITRDARLNTSSTESSAGATNLAMNIGSIPPLIGATDGLSLSAALDGLSGLAGFDATVQMQGVMWLVSPVLSSADLVQSTAIEGMRTAISIAANMSSPATTFVTSVATANSQRVLRRRLGLRSTTSIVRYFLLLTARQARSILTDLSGFDERLRRLVEAVDSFAVANVTLPFSGVSGLLTDPLGFSLEHIGGQLELNSIIEEAGLGELVANVSNALSGVVPGLPANATAANSVAVPGDRAGDSRRSTQNGVESGQDPPSTLEDAPLTARTLEQAAVVGDVLSGTVVAVALASATAAAAGSLTAGAATGGAGGSAVVSLVSEVQFVASLPRLKSADRTNSTSAMDVIAASLGFLLLDIPLPFGETDPGVATATQKRRRLGANETASADVGTVAANMLVPAAIEERFQATLFWFSLVFVLVCLIQLLLLMALPRCLSAARAAQVCKTVLAHTKLQTQVVSFTIYALALNASACLGVLSEVAPSAVVGAVFTLLLCFAYIFTLVYYLRFLVTRKVLYREDGLWKAGANAPQKALDPVASAPIRSCGPPSDMADYLSRFGGHVEPFKESFFWYCGVKLSTSVLTAIVVGCQEGDSNEAQQTILLMVYAALFIFLVRWKPFASSVSNTLSAISALNRVGVIFGTLLAQSSAASVRKAGGTTTMAFAASAIIIKVLTALYPLAKLAPKLLDKMKGSSSAVVPSVDSRSGSEKT